MVIGAVIIKHKLCLSDEETIQQIQENPYLSRVNYFVRLATIMMAGWCGPFFQHSDDASSGSNGTKAEKTVSQTASSTPAKAELTNRGKSISRWSLAPS